MARGTQVYLRRITQPRRETGENLYSNLFGELPPLIAIVNL